MTICFTQMKKVKRFLQKNICYCGDTVAAMAAFIVLMIIKMYLNLKEHNFYMKEKSGKKNKNTDALKSVKPSGVSDTDFFQQVFDIARQIPKGRVTSYGAIARYIGTGKSARMVGWAMNASHTAKPKVPAHRVVNSQGLLTGKFHFETPTKMEELLLKEKIKVQGSQVMNFKEKFWDPAEEI